MEELRGRLVQRIQHVAESGDKNKYKMLNDLLEKSFPVIKVNKWFVSRPKAVKLYALKSRVFCDSCMI